MRIGIITFHMASNYGAVLQAYALSKYLSSIGHDPIVIDYRPKYLDAITGKPNWGNLGLTYPMNWLSCRRFDHFRKTHLHLTPQQFETNEELVTSLEHMDAYLCGSDQIWNPDLTHGSLDPAYFLSFAPVDAVRISYGASFGRDVFPDDQQESLRQLLSHLDEISVREPTGIDIVQRAVGRAAAHVVDPTLLIDNYDHLISPKRCKRPYLLFFRLQREPYIYNVVDRLSRVLRLPIVTITYNKRLWQEPGRRILNPGPSEWLFLFKNASAIVTNSFHGTVFALLFRKRFIATHLAGDHRGRNGRLDTLLTMAGLSDRFAVARGDACETVFAREIDWKAVSRSLAVYRSQSEAFLVQALSRYEDVKDSPISRLC